MIRSAFICLLVGWFSAAGVAFGQGQGSTPKAMVESVTEEVLTVLKDDPQIREGDRRRAMALIEERIAPHFDFDRMTALAVGKSWRDATAAQREALVEHFRRLLVRTYANSLTAYSGQRVEFRPTRGGQQPDEVVVRSRIMQAGSPPVPLDYRLVRQNGEWKVYDVVVNNVSLVTSYRGSFASEITTGGIEGLIEALESRNRSTGAAPS